MRSQKTLIVVLIVAAAAAIVAYGLFETPGPPIVHDRIGNRSVPDPTTVEVGDVTAAYQPVAIGNGDRRPENNIEVVLPPPGIPLSESRTALTALADRGDATANCRLALELMLCSSIDDDTLALLDGLAREGSAMQAVSDTLDRTEGVAEHCGQASEVPADEPVERAHNAALLGGTRHRVLYALTSPDGMISRLHNPAGLSLSRTSNRPVSQFYAENAFQFLEEGFMQRDLLALEGLVLAYAPTPLLRVFPLRIQRPDPFKFVVMAGLYEALGAGLLPSDVAELRNLVAADLETDVRDQARGMIDREITRWSADPGSLVPPKQLSPAAVDELCQG